MKTRIITGVVAFGILIPFLIWSGSPKPVFIILSVVLSVMAVYEILDCVGLTGKLFISIPAYLTTICASIITRIVKTHEQYFATMFIVYFMLIFASLVVATFSKGKIPITDVALAVVMTIYISFAFSSIVLLRDLTVIDMVGGTFNIGKYMYLLVFIFAWFPDMGGYFVGMLLGKHKLIPDVSPKKTVEGLFGGVLFAVIAAIVYGFIIGLRIDNIAALAILVVMAVITAFMSVCGDLIASLIKRHYQIKDYGFVFPGHGGVLDRFDSVIAVAPFMYIINYAANYFGLLSGFETLFN